MGTTSVKTIEMMVCKNWGRLRFSSRNYPNQYPIMVVLGWNELKSFGIAKTVLVLALCGVKSFVMTEIGLFRAKQEGISVCISILLSFCSPVSESVHKST